jgi:hypothetical protein
MPMPAARWPGMDQPRVLDVLLGLLQQLLAR